MSDALHESITQRFVDRRSAFLVRHLASERELMAAVSKAGEVLVEGAYVGRLDGLPDALAEHDYHPVQFGARITLYERDAPFCSS